MSDIRNFYRTNSIKSSGSKTKTNLNSELDESK